MTKNEFNLKYWMFYMQLENDNIKLCIKGTIRCIWTKHCKYSKEVEEVLE